MKKLFLLICILAVFLSDAQTTDSMSLIYCLDQTVANFPLIKQKDIYPVMSNLRIENLSKNYLPQMTANGFASYQSDVTSIPVNMPGIPEIYKDNYKATLDINQMVMHMIGLHLYNFRNRKQALAGPGRPMDARRVLPGFRSLLQ